MKNGKEKYRMFRNYMVNELGIGKDDIERWVDSVITREVKNIIASDPHLIHRCAERLLKYDIDGKRWQSIKQQIEMDLGARIKLEVIEPPPRDGKGEE